VNGSGGFIPALKREAFSSILRKFAKFSLKRRLVKVLLAVGVVFIKNRMAVQLY
jgi:hypothetical protein